MRHEPDAGSPGSRCLPTGADPRPLRTRGAGRTGVVAAVVYHTPDDFAGQVRVRRVRFRSQDDRFAILDADVDGEPVTLRLRDIPLSVEAEDVLHVTGRWQTHPTHGRQVVVRAAQAATPQGRRAALSFLGSIEGVGPGRAEKLLALLGADLFAAVDADPEGCFLALPGVGAKTARRAAESWRSRRGLRELHLLLAEHGLARLATRLDKHYGGPGAAEAAIRADPYRLTELHGVGFLTADKIARSVGVDPSSPRRAHAVIVHLLREAEGDGHSFLPWSGAAGLGPRAEALLGSACPHERVLELAREGTVRLESLSDGRTAVYRAATHRRERRVARRLRELATAPMRPDGARASARPLPGELTEQQQQAIHNALTNGLSVVTGGPGTGKSSLIRALLTTARSEDLRVELCAPTGRAARRMTQLAGAAEPAATVHRRVEWDPIENRPGRGTDHPLDADLVICDEASMLNLQTIEMLLDALAPSSGLVLVGDVDQLPPIGAGKPFADLIDSDAAPIVRLTRIFRQAARSMIVQTAHAMNAGRPPDFRTRPDMERDVFFIARNDPAAVADEIVQLAARRLPTFYDADPVRDVQVLSPIYKGPMGILELNRRLRERLNPDGAPACRGRLRIGDKLIQTRNDHATGLLNGQVAELLEDHPGTEPSKGELLLDVDGDRVAVPYERTGSLVHAYAISVHKSQGSEIPVVVVPVHRSHAIMLTRNLLYTAVSRASRALVIVGQREAIALGVRRAEGAARFSRLPELLDGRRERPARP
jgi:exodeoxyribonuclease V alpha subunit